MSDITSPTPADETQRVPFENLLRLLDPNRERAGEKYENLRRKLIKFFEWNSCFPAEDLTDETFKRLEQRIGQPGIRNVTGFAWGIAKNVRQEARKKAGRTIQISREPGKEKPWRDSHDVEKAIIEKMQRERRFRCLQLCLQRIPINDRELFLDYHNVKGQSLAYRKDLAQRLGLVLSTLRVRVNRLRNQLEKCVRQCVAAQHINSTKIS